MKAHGPQSKSSARVHYTRDTTELFSVDCQSNFMKLTQKLIVLSFHKDKKNLTVVILKNRDNGRNNE